MKKMIQIIQSQIEHIEMTFNTMVKNNEINIERHNIFIGRLTELLVILDLLNIRDKDLYNDIKEEIEMKIYYMKM